MCRECVVLLCLPPPSLSVHAAFFSFTFDEQRAAMAANTTKIKTYNTLGLLQCLPYTLKTTTTKKKHSPQTLPLKFCSQALFGSKQVLEYLREKVNY